jgi:hypothetical protein
VGGGGDVCRNNDSHLFCLPIKVVVFPISAYLEIRFLTPGKMPMVVESTFELEFTQIAAVKVQN